MRYLSKLALAVAFLSLACFSSHADNGYAGESAKAIDLGLSVQWANHNMGANTPEESGFLLGFADPTGGMLESDDDLYPNANPPENISGTMYDIAHTKWGGHWRLPTETECNELISNCKFSWTTRNGVTGGLFTASNGNSIFFPAVGYRDSTSFEDENKSCRIWSGTSADNTVFVIFMPLEVFDGQAVLMSNDNDEAKAEVYSEDRHRGLSVRPVYDINYTQELAVVPRDTTNNDSIDEENNEDDEGIEDSSAEGSGVITKVAYQYDVTHDGKSGMDFLINFDVSNMKDKKCLCCVYLYNVDNGSKLINPDAASEYKTKDENHVSVSGSFTPNDDQSSYYEYRLFCPYSAMRPNRAHKMHLKTMARLYDTKNAKWLTHGDVEGPKFTLTW